MHTQQQGPLDFAARMGCNWVDRKQQRKIARFVRLYGALRGGEHDRVCEGERIYGSVAELWQAETWSTDIYTLQDARRHMKGNIDRVRNRRNGQTCDITVLDTLKLCEQQDWRCAYSGQPLDFTRGGQMWQGKWCNPSSATIDRIDSDRAYTPDNIQIIEWRYNCLKSAFSVEELTEMCENIYRAHKGKS
jgi:hypothetical protein